jgi:putative acetyltransferase
MNIIHVQTPQHVEEIRSLFREYEQFLNVDLCFQGFEEELAGLPGRYGPPAGALLMALDGEYAAGCVALREIDEGVCEMKRLYVRPGYRGDGIGRQLAQSIIDQAISLGYTLMRLDTLDTLKQAMGLYSSFGFTKTAPYYDNPLEGVVYWELPLNGSRSD